MKGVSIIVVLAAVLYCGCIFTTSATAAKAPWPKNITEIITGYGYPCEQHTAQTADGYLLSLQRIPYGRTSNRGKGVVFFQHGYSDNAVGIVLVPPNEGLAFILADAGYDVWLGNNRGNGLSMKHIKYNTNQPQFWNFTWDDMANYDLPANIDYVLKVTGKKQLTYMGHSEGTTQAFAGFENASVAAKVNLYIALAPVAKIHHVEVPLLVLLAQYDAPEILAMFGVNELIIPEVIHKLLPDVCYFDPKLCDDDLALIMGPSIHINATRLDYILNYEPNPTSVLNTIHWIQEVNTDAFQKFDYGPAGNMIAYGQSTPPAWNIQNIPKTLPIALFSGSNDYLADPTDVKWLLEQLPTPPVFYHNEATYAHMDFLWAENAYQTIYPMILDLLAKYN